MKNVTRGALTAIALVSALGITACGPAAAPSEQAAQGSSSASASATPSVDPNKAKGFTTSFTVNGNSIESLPAEWKGGEGKKVESPYVIGNLVGYLDAPDSGTSDQSAPPSTSTSNQSQQLFVIDDKGIIVYKSKPLDVESSDLMGSELGRVFSNGKNYLVHIQEYKLKQDPSSTRTAETASSVTIIDEQGKETSSQTIKSDDVSVTNDAVVIAAAKTGEVAQVIDPVTGKVTALPVPKDYQWYGRFDGVDVFGLVEAEGFSAEGSLTNGTWTAKVNADLDETSVPDSFGTLMRVKRYVGFGKGALSYDLMDPHTGKIVLGADMKEGVPFSSKSSFNDKDTLTSPDRKFVITNDDKGKGNGVFSITENKHYPIAEELNFQATSVTNDGYVYGQTNNGRAGYNVLKETEPKIIAGASATPSEVSDSGIGIFGNAIVLKPQS